ncbi:NAD(P)-dependent oxidoreductase [Clostridium estertheticum]|uniref:NAD-dependent epimerase/dehydratase family protein n=1 Tax=Clostridium estertheticum TaxID=238834 RepID=UPI0013E9866A|nr:NAD(P)-dependent oxidoreductase [Clostridium estertheticum]MBZ9686400.1 NAD(P)-dependent oxidoreductase [Clostridium estertheticum]
MKKAIVTGASGFVGGWLVKELVSRGVKVIAVVRSEESNMTVLRQYDNVSIVVCPIEKITTLPLLILDDDIDVFYHFAWAGTSGVDRADIKLQLSNVKATCDAVKVASEIGCIKFVNAGSIMEYEAVQYIPADGTEPVLSNIYSTAKQTADFMAKTLAVSLKLSYVNAIISNIFGTGEKSERFINTAIRNFLNKGKTTFTHGEQLYDFIYASDAARAFYLVGQSGKSYTSYYIGNPKPYPLKDFITRMKNIVDENIELNFGEIPYQGALLKYTEFDTTKLHNEFGFETEVTFEQGIEKTVQWIQNNN